MGVCKSNDFAAAASDRFCACSLLHRQQSPAHERALRSCQVDTGSPSELGSDTQSLMVAAFHLNRRFQPGYPHTEAVLRVKDHEGLALPDQRALSKQLHAAVAGFAADGAVCAFDLVNICQGFLQERNAHAAAHPDEDAPVSEK